MQLFLDHVSCNLRRRLKKRKYYTILDAPNAQSVVRFVRACGGAHDDADTIANKLERILRTFVPNELMMRGCQF